MKTAIEIRDDIINAAKKLAVEKRLSLKILVEKGLLMVIEEQKLSPGSFELEDASVQGQGFSENFEGASWTEIRAVVYRD